MTTSPSIDIAAPQADDIAILGRIYTSSFPPEERRHWHEITEPEHPGHPALHAIYRDGKAAGLLTTWEFDGFIYIEHFAIDSSLRGDGIGSRVIAEMKNVSAKPLLLEVEPAGSAPEADRRISFYERHGFKVVDRTYIQPSYYPELPSIALWLMSTAPVDTAEATRLLHSKVYGVK